MFYEINFPESVSIRSKHHIEYNTSVHRSKNGREQRISNMEQPLSYYDVVSGVKTTEEINELVKFFKLMEGRACGFRFKDWLDYGAENQIIGVGDNKNKTFQLIKMYTITVENETISHIRKITKPVKNKVDVFVNGVKYNDFLSLDYTTGVVTFDEPPATDEVVTATFEFDVPVRFDVDNLEIIMNNVNSGEINNLKLVEINI
ncbi:MAG: DUF2460 domain-containing protein [Rickettsiales bacterium]|nr:DUF2460 domain-containing protein [Rickettsiales bacterium]